MQQHRYPFFGQKVGLLFDSGPQTLPSVFFRLIKKKNSGVWEKPSSQEGKAIKFNLLELISIIEVLDHPGSKWSTVHRFKQDSTPITFEHKGKNVVIFLPGYQKYLNLNEIALLCDILKHVYEEKIAFSTGGTQNQPELQKSNNHRNSTTIADLNTPNTSKITDSTAHTHHQTPTPQQKNPIANNHLEGSDSMTNQTTSLGNQQTVQVLESSSPQKWLQTLQLENEYFLLPGHIEARSQKAVAFQVEGKNSTWIPISCIKEAITSGPVQGIWVKKWFVEKRIEDILTA